MDNFGHVLCVYAIIIIIVQAQEDVRTAKMAKTNTIISVLIFIIKQKTSEEHSFSPIRVTENLRKQLF